MTRIFDARPKTEVYLNPEGQIVIRQTGDCVPEMEQFVFFEVDQIDAIVGALLETKKERLEDWRPEESEVET